MSASKDGGTLVLMDLRSLHVLHLADHMMVLCGFPVCQRQENKSFVVGEQPGGQNLLVNYERPH